MAYSEDIARDARSDIAQTAALDNLACGVTARRALGDERAPAATADTAT